MCGIFGYIGRRDAVPIVLNGLKKLEYRGYDSAGMAGIKKGQIVAWKEVGKLAILEKEVLADYVSMDIAVGHTRWATHGAPNKTNAHPHFDANHTVAVVHNGIIENHEQLRTFLKSKGVKFISETDTEVVAHLIATFYEGDFLKATQKAVSLLEGAYALGIIHRDFPDRIIAVANQCPLVVGIGKEEAFVSSDTHALAAHTKEVLFLTNAEIAVVTAEKTEVYNTLMEQVSKDRQALDLKVEDTTKGGFEHYTLKEIFQQPQTVRNAFSSRFVEEQGNALFDEVAFDINDLMGIQEIIILACGTSWHAGLIGSYMLEDLARIPTRVEISSEFRYKNPIIPHGTYVIAISQSGETADTIAAVKEAKSKGAKILAICNVQGSTLVRESDVAILLRAGPEIGVCSTKAFTSQVTVLSLFTLMMARMRHMSKQEGQRFLHALQKLPDQIQEILDNAPQIASIAKKYAKFDNFFFIGRRYMYPTSLEGALKLKEISYINANGYPAGEMKHGPIALLNDQCPVVALCGNKLTYQKFHSNIMESKARNAPVLAIAEQGVNKVENVADDVVRIPQTIDELAAILTTAVTQLLAYYIAKERGADIDQPRNLAKSVTVE